MNYEQTFADFFTELGDAAGAIALKYFRKLIPVDEKEDKSPVTQADREIEQELRDMIDARFPNHGIIGEEFGRHNPDAEFVWVIDPIDGTKSFATGRPLFGTIVGLMHNGVPVVGMIDQAFTKERWFGVTDKIARHNGAAVRVAAPRTIDNARLYIGSVSMFDDSIPHYINLCRAAKWTQHGCDCYAYGLLAMGWCDLVVEQKLGLYDVAGIVPIITGAGGFIGDWQGNPITAKFNGKAIAASTRALADQALAVISPN